MFSANTTQVVIARYDSFFSRARDVERKYEEMRKAERNARRERVIASLLEVRRLSLEDHRAEDQVLARTLLLPRARRSPPARFAFYQGEL